MRNQLTRPAYDAIRHALELGGLFVARGPHAPIGVINAIAKAHRGDTRKAVEINPRTGQRTHVVTGVALTRLGLVAFRDMALERGDTLPAALIDMLAATAPRPPAARVFPSITHRADPFALVASPVDDIPF